MHNCRSRKAQMFIVTMVFMAAMVFSMQGLLLSYARTDLAALHRSSDSYLIENMEIIFQHALDSSDDCLEARSNVIELKGMIGSQIMGSYDLNITGDVSCPWPASGPDLDLDITVTRENGETKSTLLLNRTP
jgi:hypothetical protein